ncbi:transposase [Singulisphaera acidiphila]|uniref:transposase n=1 Tax=Singulisphaera acidiphila TaxID=466153 RepID=UPI00024711AD|nr:transposase [Singulisphaera acidiphila]
MTPYSQDLRQRILEAVRRGDGSLRQIARRSLVSVSFVTRLLRRHRSTGSLGPRPQAEATRRYSGRRTGSGSGS